MQATPLERSSPAQAIVVAGVTLAAIALLGWVLAYWTWAWLAPSPEPHAPAAQDTGVKLQAAYGLFGRAQRSAAAAASGIVVTLLGVVAASAGRSGHALLRIDGKTAVAVREGAQIDPGVRLAEVHPDHVVLERGGVRESIALPRHGRAAATTAPLSPPPVSK